MKITAIITAYLSILLLASELICGMWLKSGNEGSVDFHARLGVAAAVVSIAGLILLMVVLKK